MTTVLPAQSALSVPATSKGLAMVAKGQFDWAETALGELSPDEVIIAVAGCGVCHTDIGFAYEGIPTRHALPLILGHEIAGRVVLAGEQRGKLDWALRHCACGNSVRRLRCLPQRASDHLPQTVHAGQ